MVLPDLQEDTVEGRYQANIKDLQNRVSYLEYLKKKQEDTIQNLTSQLQESESKVASHFDESHKGISPDSDNESLQHLKDQNQQLLEKIGKLTAEAHAAEEQTALQDKLIEKDNALHQARLELAEYKTQVDQQQEELQKIKQGQHRSKQEKQDQQLKLGNPQSTEMSTRLHKMELKLTEAQLQITKLKKQAAAAKKAKSDAIAELKNSQTQVTDYFSKIGQLEQQLNESQTSVISLQKENGYYKEKLERLQNERNNYKEQLESLQKENNKTKENIERIQKEVSSSQQQQHGLQNQMKQEQPQLKLQENIQKIQQANDRNNVDFKTSKQNNTKVNYYSFQ